MFSNIFKYKEEWTNEVASFRYTFTCNSKMDLLYVKAVKEKYKAQVFLITKGKEHLKTIDFIVPKRMKEWGEVQKMFNYISSRVGGIIYEFARSDPVPSIKPSNIYSPFDPYNHYLRDYNENYYHNNYDYHGYNRYRTICVTCQGRGYIDGNNNYPIYPNPNPNIFNYVPYATSYRSSYPPTPVVTPPPMTNNIYQIAQTQPQPQAYTQPQPPAYTQASVDPLYGIGGSSIQSPVSYNQIPQPTSIQQDDIFQPLSVGVQQNSSAQYNTNPNSQLFDFNQNMNQRSPLDPSLSGPLDNRYTAPTFSSPLGTETTSKQKEDEDMDVGGLFD